MNWIPGVSQLKSTIQLVTGDFKGAAQTQKDFFQQCPVVSQVTAVVQLITGDKEAAKETYKKGVGIINDIVNSVSVVADAKSLINLVCDDEKRAEESFTSSTRTFRAIGEDLNSGDFAIRGIGGAVEQNQFNAQIQRVKNEAIRVHSKIQNNKENNLNNQKTSQINKEHRIRVNYEDFSRIQYGSIIKAFVKLQDELVDYFKSTNGQAARQNRTSVVIIDEILHDGSRIETRMRTRDLYVVQVTVYDSHKNTIVQEVNDGVIGDYNRGTLLIPIQEYPDSTKSRSPGALLRSQAFRISVSLRFKRSFGRDQTSGFNSDGFNLDVFNLDGFREDYKMWPELKTKHIENGMIVTKLITPFEYASVHRGHSIDFGMFRVFYGRWEDLSDEFIRRFLSS